MPRVMVTGVSGFIGSNMYPKLVERDHEVWALERYVTGRYELGRERRFNTVFGDLRNYFDVKRVIHEVLPEYVIHLAAISPVSYSYDHPNEVIESNFVGTVNLAEACLREVQHFKQFLFASTSETYGNGPSPKTEETPQYPNSPYAVTKMAAEKYLLYMDKAYGFPVTILRNFNTYGRTNNTHFVVERTIVQMLSEKMVNLGDPRPIRDLMYVEDHADSYLTCLGNQKTIGQVFNFCTGRGVSIEDLTRMIAEITGYKGTVNWNMIPARPLEIMELVGDYSKAKRMLNWEPRFTLEEGLKLTVDHWRKKIEAEK